jgi:hypothetical protein
MTWSLLLLLAHADQPVSFRNEVMAVLSRAGCNSGPCHGNLNGKGGLKLSLRGQDADFDFDALTRGALGRRIDTHSPTASLILAKATMAQPHEGGQRFPRSGQEYALLRDWIAQGAKLDPATSVRPVRLAVSPHDTVLHGGDRVRLRVTATFSDGSKRDVTKLACFEVSNLSAAVGPDGTVRRLAHGEPTILVRYLHTQAVARVAFMPNRPGFVWKDRPEANYIDRHVHKRLKALHVEPSPPCTDSEFIRRASLDACGILPTASETKRFLADTRTDKRARLIDALLKRPEFADFWALKWADLLRIEEKVLDVRGTRVFHGWVRRAILDDRPLDAFARELIAGRGSSYSDPPSNYYRALREPYARAEATAQVFLGVRIQCAKCHNHPFDRWTQDDYHRFASTFARVQYRVLENNRRDKLDKHEFAGEQIVYQDRTSELKHPVSGDVLAPRFLGEDAPAVKPGGDRLTLLAEWATRADNPFFARAQANRVWQHLIGRGLVDPGDDFRDSNPPLSEELLAALAKDLAQHRFSLRHLVRRVMNSHTYQRSAAPTATNRDDETGLSRAIIRPLQAEVLLDAAAQVCGVRPRFPNVPRGTRAVQLPGVGADRRRKKSDSERFLAAFGKPVRSLSCECERNDDSTLAQALQMLTGPVLDSMLTKPDNVLGKRLDATKEDRAVLDELYLAALCRYPTKAEREAALALIARARGRRAGLEDVLWCLLNAKEFLLRR